MTPLSPVAKYVLDMLNESPGQGHIVIPTGWFFHRHSLFDRASFSLKELQAGFTELHQEGFISAPLRIKNMPLLYRLGK